MIIMGSSIGRGPLGGIIPIGMGSLGPLGPGPRGATMGGGTPRPPACMTPGGGGPRAICWGAMGGRRVTGPPRGICEERSDEWKVINYVAMWYNDFADASLRPSFAPHPISPAAAADAGGGPEGWEAGSWPTQGAP